jgi:hypothetical protein
MEDDPDVRCGVLSPPGSNSIKSHSKKLAVSADRKRDPALFNLAIAFGV